MVKVWTFNAAGVCVQLETPDKKNEVAVGCGAKGLLIGMNMLNVLANTNTCVFIYLIITIASGVRCNEADSCPAMGVIKLETAFFEDARARG